MLKALLKDGLWFSTKCVIALTAVTLLMFFGLLLYNYFWFTVGVIAGSLMFYVALVFITEY